MPAKFRIKQYLNLGYYHIYNKGIDGRDVFIDQSDYQFFVSLLKRYLCQYKDEIRSGFKSVKPSIRVQRENMNLESEVDLICYCLMPNHFHLLLQQKTSNGMTKLMRRVGTNYSMYFNRKYKRSGPLFENVYKAVVVGDLQKVLMLTKHIHLNPEAKSVRRFGLVETVVGTDPSEYLYSSYKDYVKPGDDLVKNAQVLNFLGDTQYKDYMKEKFILTNDLNILLLDTPE